MSETSGETPTRSRRWLRWVGGGLLTLTPVLGISGALVARALPGWLCERSAPRQADAMVVLAGDCSGGRVDAACALFQQGYVPQGPLIISGGTLYGELTWAQAMAARARAHGVPEERIVLQDRSRTTAEDARFVAELLHQRGASVVLLVTGAWHSGRAAPLLRRELGDGVQVISCPSDEPYPQPWWRDAAATRALVTEVLKRMWPGDGS